MNTYELQPGFGFENLNVVDRPAPSPGPGQVLVDMRAWSLNYRDLLVTLGHYNPKMKLPIVPLSDGAGEVVAVGSGVTRVKVGDRVAGCFMQRWSAGCLTDDALKSALGGAIDGVLAEQVVFSEDGVVKIPERLSFEDAATLPCAALTAWNALVVSGGVKAGDTVLMQGTGGVSLFALQFAKLHGRRSLPSTATKQPAQITRRRQNQLRRRRVGQRVVELTGGADHVVEVGGGDAGRAARAVKTGGHRGHRHPRRRGRESVSILRKPSSCTASSSAAGRCSRRERHRPASLKPVIDAFRVGSVTRPSSTCKAVRILAKSSSAAHERWVNAHRRQMIKRQPEHRYTASNSTPPSCVSV